MKYTYKFSKGFWKGVSTIIFGLITFVSFTSFSDVTLMTLFTTYIEPVVGSLTVAGALKIAYNFVKYNYLSEE